MFRVWGPNMLMVPLSLKTANLLAVFYADPGSGALLWQLIGSFFIGLLFYFRRFAAWLSPGGDQKRSKDALSNEE